MTLALTSNSPISILSLYPDGTTTIRLPNGNTVNGVMPGWTSGVYALVTVIPFAPPPWQEIVPGSTGTYFIDSNGIVTVTYPTQPLTPPIGFWVNSTSAPTINGTYNVDITSQLQVYTLASYVSINARFPAGVNHIIWTDNGGTPHTFTSQAVWLAFAAAMMDYCVAISYGSSPTQPTVII